MKQVYLAASFGCKNKHEYRKNAERAAEILTEKGFQVFCPWLYQVPHAWDYYNTEWGLMVFAHDCFMIDTADVVVMLSYGRDSTAGANWEAGYAYGKGKPVVVAEMTDDVMSLMVANGRYATVKGLDGLMSYDFEEMPKTRSDTEQK